MKSCIKECSARGCRNAAKLAGSDPRSGGSLPANPGFLPPPKQGRVQHILNPLIDVQKRFGESRAENRLENRLQTGSPAFAGESVSFAQTRRSSWEVGRR